MEENKTTNVGFHSIHLTAVHDITIKKGRSIKCNNFFVVNDGVLCVSSETGSITLSLPQTDFKTIEIESKAGSVKCNGMSCKQLTISTSCNVIIKNARVNDECNILSQNDSIYIKKSKIDKAHLNAKQIVNLGLDDFSYIEVKSECDGVNFTYNGTQVIHASCTSKYGTVKARGAFYGGADCNKKIIVSATQDINLRSRKK